MNANQNILLVYASKKGSTTKYANLLGKLIGTKPVEVNSVEHIDANLIVIGTPFYSNGKLSSSITDFIERYHDELSNRNLAVFIVGARKSEWNFREIAGLLPQPPVAHAVFRSLRRSRHRDRRFGDKFLMKLGFEYKKLKKSDITDVKAFANKIRMVLSKGLTPVGTDEPELGASLEKQFDASTTSGRINPTPAAQLRCEEGKIEKTLALALDVERKGADFYISLASKTKQPLAKKLFYSLAKQEINHMERIEELFSEFEPTTGPSYPRSIEEEIKGLFDKLSKAALKGKLDNIEGYKKALELEQESYDLYEDLAQKAKTEREKEFFEALMAEEKEHYVALQNVHNFLTDSEQWFHIDEAKAWNWMNL